MTAEPEKKWQVLINKQSVLLDELFSLTNSYNLQETQKNSKTGKRKLLSEKLYYKRNEEILQELQKLNEDQYKLVKNTEENCIDGT